MNFRKIFASIVVAGALAAGLLACAGDPLPDPGDWCHYGIEPSGNWAPSVWMNDTPTIVDLSPSTGRFRLSYIFDGWIKWGDLTIPASQYPFPMDCTYQQLDDYNRANWDPPREREQILKAWEDFSDFTLNEAEFEMFDWCYLWTEKEGAVYVEVGDVGKYYVDKGEIHDGRASDCSDEMRRSILERVGGLTPEEIEYQMSQFEHQMSQQGRSSP